MESLEVYVSYDKKLVTVQEKKRNGKTFAGFSSNQCWVNNLDQEVVLNKSPRIISKKAWSQFIETVNKHLKVAVDPDSFDLSSLNR